jgi:O-antigen/teichoic acid export membrane protein
MAVGLYTSRVILTTLGINDYGLNVVVTSAITVFFFLNGSIAGATSRFLTIELGKQDFEKLKRTFSAAITIHIIIALIILILGETIGLWYLENKMVIPEGRMTAARWIYQLSLVSAMITVIQVPYNASIIAHEKMNVYAYIEILNTCLKLGIVYLLIIGNFDKLILYAILTLCVSIVITLIYRAYCIRRFEECRYKFEWDKKIIYPMFSFSGWNLFGMVGISAKDQGVNLVLNLFFTTVANAAYGIAYQVFAAIEHFAFSFIVSARPQIVKYYSTGKIKEMRSLMNNVSKFASLLLFSLCLPLILEIKFILNIWLGKVPEYTVIFCYLFLVNALIFPLNTILNTAIEATGKIKQATITRCIIYILIPIISYLLFKYCNIDAWLPLFMLIMANLAVFMAELLILRYLIRQFSILEIFRKVVLTCIAIIVISTILPVFLHVLLSEGWVRCLLVTLSSLSCTIVATYFIAMNKQMRAKIIIGILGRLH